MDDVKRIDIAEFRVEGYLQELNRRFLHPLGLALEVERLDDGTERLGGVWDYRDDLEGIRYAGELPDREKAERITALWLERMPARREALGYVVQPAGSADVDNEDLADRLNEVWEELRQLPLGGRGHIADTVLEAAAALRGRGQ